MYIICIGLVLVASVLLILAVLVQSPKSGMAANFGASNQVMGVRQTSDFLEKFTWAMAIGILVLSLVATMVMGGSKGSVSASEEIDKLNQSKTEQTSTNSEAATEAETSATTEAPAEDAVPEATEATPAE